MSIMTEMLLVHEYFDCFGVFFGAVPNQIHAITGAPVLGIGILFAIFTHCLKTIVSTY